MSTAVDVITGGARWYLNRGDSLAWLRSLPDACVDAVITDPPYATVSTSSSVVTWKVKFLPPEGQFFEAWLREHAREWVRVLRSTGGIWMTIDWHGALSFERVCSELGLLRPSIGVWDRGGLGMGHILRHTYECFVAVGMPDFQRKLTDSADVWRHQWTPGNRTAGHSAEKPIPLMTQAIDLLCDPGSVVLDPFGGSGTTGVAALRKGHRVLISEMGPIYQDMIAARLSAEVAGIDWRAPDQLGLFPAEGR